MAYQSKFTGVEVDSLLEKVQKGEAGGKVTVDSSLSTTSENPVMNKVITEELNKKLEGEVVGTTSPTEGTVGGSYDDTELRNQLAEADAKLTELSEEVGELSERIDEGVVGPQGPQGEQGPKGDKGDQGNSGYTGAAGELEVVNNLTQGGATAALSAEMGKVLGEEASYLDVRMNGAVSYSIGSSASGWHYYQIMALRKGTYRFSIELSAAVSATMYWTIVADGTATTILPSKAIFAGTLLSEVELTLSQDYENCQVGIYAGVAKPSCIFSVIAPTSIKGELKQLREVKTILSSSKYFYASDLLSESAAYPRLLKNQHKGRVDGVKISISKGGTLVLAKAIGTNGDNTNPSFEVLQTFNVKVGINYLDFDVPVMLEENEGIVIYTGSTASFHRAPYSATNDTGSMYFNGKNWMTMPNGDVMATYANDMSNAMERLAKVEKETRTSVVYPVAPPSLYHHLFISKIDKDSTPVVPCQSVFDVAVAAKLGFKMIEFNVQETSDGVAVTGHPVSGTIQTLDDLDGNPVALTIGSMNYAALRNNYRYRSAYPQFRTPISSLEECLRECQRYDLTPMVQCVSKSVVELTESIVGKRYVAYGGTRKLTDALIYIYHSSGTIDSLLEQCDIVGYPYMLGISPTLLDSWTDDEIKDLLKRAHAKGAWVNWAGCYHTPESNLRMKRLGLDSCASGWEVIDFVDYDIRKVGNIVKGFADFTGTFSTNADGANLATGQHMKVEIGKMGILSKGQLSIQFVGKLSIAFGSTKTNGVYESDGSSILTINSIIENEADLVITASADSKVYSIDYKTAIVI